MDQTLLRATCAAFLIATASCMTVAGDNAEDQYPPAPIPPLSNQVDETIPDKSDTVSQQGFDIEEGTLEEGFCKDDVFASYLMEKYKEAEEPSIRKISSSRSRQSARRRLEVDALFHARHRLVGPMKPFFGALPVVANSKVEYWMRYFKTRGRHSFLKWLVRASSVSELVAPLLSKEGLPAEIFFLGMIESGFSNTAYSRASATGPWQFMKGTAQLYGLKINYWVDERRDPVKSTIAAARYLKDMYTRFGDWYLAMASYNAGPGRISRAIRRSRSRDFWKIAETGYIHTETKHYVPKVLAAVILASDLKGHGFDVIPDPASVTPETYVEVDKPISLSEVAKHLDIPERVLRRWNPELLQGVTPPIGRTFKGPYQLRLMPDQLETFAQIEAKLSDLEIADVKMYEIRKGDTLSGIAEKHNVTIHKIRHMNPNLRDRALRVGKRIAIPVPSVQIMKKRKRA